MAGGAIWVKVIPPWTAVPLGALFLGTSNGGVTLPCTAVRWGTPRGLSRGKVGTVEDGHKGEHEKRAHLYPFRYFYYKFECAMLPLVY